MWKIIDKYDWESIRGKFSWIRDMKEVPQDEIYHAEGDVETHTRMVKEALMNLTEFQELNEQEQHILVASALLHDVEKRSTTVIEENGRITSRGHAKKGEFTARSILYREIETPFEIREMIAKLVRYHGLPLWIFEKPDPQKALIQSSTEVNTEWLAMLAKADVLGRICDDQEELLYKIDLFKELCRENKCYGNAYQFPDNYSRFFYFNKQNTTPDFQAYDDTKFEVILMSALPGSGKDTYIKKYLRDLPLISLDEIRRKMKISPTDKSGNGKVIQEAKESAKIFMRKHESFVWNATNITRQLRSQLIDLFVSYCGKVKIIYLEVPYRQLKKQNKNREEIVPENVMDKLAGKLEIPVVSEAYEVIYEI